jgi:hypothetical protein
MGADTPLIKARSTLDGDRSHVTNRGEGTAGHRVNIHRRTSSTYLAIFQSHCVTLRPLRITVALLERYSS